MDGPPPHMLPPNLGAIPAPTLPHTARKRPRELESPEQRAKREKATERQRRKRARDREALLHNSELAPMSQVEDHNHNSQPPPPFDTPLSSADNHLPPPPGEFGMQVQAEAGPSQPNREPTMEELDAMRAVETAHEAITGQSHRQPLTPAELSAEESAKRERVRIAARERQRKHRALVKQRKMRELGIDMGNEVIPPHMPYELPLNHGGYQPQHHEHGAEGGLEGGMVQPQGGAMFAQTLLLAFACAPLLKGPVLRSLGMSQEDLNQFEGIIASAWDQWDFSRRQYHAHQAAQAAQQAISNGAAAAAVAAAVGANGGPNDDDSDRGSSEPAPNDFRARFRQSIAPPLPAGIPQPAPAAVIDPELGQGRIEAEAVADHLERFERSLQG
ncbi:hypothetical protein PENSPDRAFT_35151 [Peniophora sp. CONT]|nr:hypothetical protein PENSPDRAFT_35151 [Peniophora sp. CONT]